MACLVGGNVVEARSSAAGNDAIVMGSCSGVDLACPGLDSAAALGACRWKLSVQVGRLRVKRYFLDAARHAVAEVPKDISALLRVDHARH